MMGALTVAGVQYRTCQPCSKADRVKVWVVAEHQTWNAHLIECHSGTEFARTARMVPAHHKIVRSAR